MIIDEAVYLEHFGVKGMRWGVRNERQKTGSSEKASQPKEKNQENQKTYFGLTKKQAEIGAGVLVGAAVCGFILAHHEGVTVSSIKRDLSWKTGEGLRDSNVNVGRLKVDRILVHSGNTKVSEILPKGQTFSRISSSAEQEMREGTYSTNLPTDSARYAMSFGGYKDAHRVKFRALTDVKMPSIQERFDTMSEIIDKPIPDLTGGKTYRKWLASRQLSKASKKYILKAPSEELGKYVYGNNVGGDWHKGVGKAFIDRLKEKGFSAMVDDNDATNGLAKHPVVLLNRANFQIMSAKKLRDVDVDRAYKVYKQALSTVA